jgi:hypothetical protein
MKGQINADEGENNVEFAGEIAILSTRIIVSSSVSKSQTAGQCNFLSMVLCTCFGSATTMSALVQISHQRNPKSPGTNDSRMRNLERTLPEPGKTVGVSACL